MVTGDDILGWIQNLDPGFKMKNCSAYRRSAFSEDSRAILFHFLLFIPSTGASQLKELFKNGVKRKYQFIFKNETSYWIFVLWVKRKMNKTGAELIKFAFFLHGNLIRPERILVVHRHGATSSQ